MLCAVFSPNLPQPYINARLSVLGGWDIFSVYPLRSLLRKQLALGLDPMLWPKWLSMPLQETPSDDGQPSDAGGIPQGHRDTKRPEGTLQLEVVRAFDLEYMFLPSPFVKVHCLGTP